MLGAKLAADVEMKKPKRSPSAVRCFGHGVLVVTLIRVIVR